jgi:hypothetical protein
MRRCCCRAIKRRARGVVRHGRHARAELVERGKEQVVEMTVNYWRQKEDAKFEEAFAKLEC